MGFVYPDINLFSYMTAYFLWTLQRYTEYGNLPTIASIQKKHIATEKCKGAYLQFYDTSPLLLLFFLLSLSLS